MPTPRHSAEIAKRARARSAAADFKTLGAWIAGTVLSGVGGISPIYQVNVDGQSGGAVPAASVIDAPITVGTLVWLVNADDKYDKYLIVGLR